MGRRCVVALVGALLWFSPAIAQETPQPVDRQDPAAVVRAYLEASKAGRVEEALALVLDDDGTVEALRLVVTDPLYTQTAVPGEYDDIRTELRLAPIQHETDLTTDPPRVEQDTATVRVAEARPRESQFVLVRDADGKWSIDFAASVRKTTGHKRSMLLAEANRTLASQERAEEALGDEDAGYPSSVWDHYSAFEAVTEALQRMADEMGSYPQADTWMDDLAAYCLDPAILEPPEGEDGGFGYALNAEVAGQPVPQDWDTVWNTATIYETTEWRRNASGRPEDELAALPEGHDGLRVGLASGMVATVPRGMTLAGLISRNEERDRCRDHVTTLCRALLQYARKHEGCLPSADSWCDDIGQYITPDAPTGLFACPSAPELEYGYAINEDLAGTDVRKLRGHGGHVLILPSEKGIRNEARAVPTGRLRTGRHTGLWPSTTPHVTLGMLDGSTQEVSEGQPFDSVRMFR